MIRRQDSTSLISAVAKSVAVVEVPSLHDFLTILAARERSKPSFFRKVQEAMKWILLASFATQLLTQRAVLVTPLLRRTLSAQGLLETTHSFALSFTFKGTLVTYLHKLPEQAQGWRADNCPNATADSQCRFSVTKLQLELAIATLGLAVPVIVGSLISHREEGTEQQLGRSQVHQSE